MREGSQGPRVLLVTSINLTIFAARKTIFWKGLFMEALKEYNVPLTGLKAGDHIYRYDAGPDFFKHFENSPIEAGQFHIEITLDRRPDMATLDFRIKGTYSCNCDRCLVKIDLPIKQTGELILKFEEGEDTDEVIFLDPQTSEWNASKVIYELICLAKPLINVYDCKGKPCDQEVLKKLDEYEHEPEPDQSIWKDLGNIKLN